MNERPAAPPYPCARARYRAPAARRLFEQYADSGGELLACPICFEARKLDEAALVGNARLAGATPLWDWIGDEHTDVFSD